MNLDDLFKSAPGHALATEELRPYVSSHTLAKLVGRGTLEYNGRGVYRLKYSSADFATAKELKGVLSHRSAARHWRFGLAEQPEVAEVIVDPGRRRMNVPDGVRVYRRRLSPDEHTDGVTTRTRTILDCARDLPAPETLAMADSAAARGWVDLEQLRQGAAEMRGPRSAYARKVVGWIDPTVISVIESVTRGVLLDGGITGFVPQFPVTISTGRVLHPDLGHEEARLLIEAEGLIAHTGGAVESDMIRYNEFAAAGYGLLRFSWNNVMHRRNWVVAMTRGALQHRLGGPI